MPTAATMAILYPHAAMAGYGWHDGLGADAAPVATPEQLRAAADYFAAQGNTTQAAALRKQADTLDAAIKAAQAKGEPSAWSQLNTFLSSSSKQALDWYKAKILADAVKAGDQAAIAKITAEGAPTSPVPPPPTTQEKGLGTAGTVMIAVGAAVAIGAAVMAFGGRGRRRNPRRSSHPRKGGRRR